MPFLDKQSWGRMAGGLLPMRTQETVRPETMGMDEFRPSMRKPGDAADALSRVCGAVGCGGSWSKPWKKRRPVFEEEWGCSARCLQSMVRAAVRRASASATGAMEDAPHRHRVPLGLVLLAQRWITHPQLQAALEQQRTGDGGRIGDLLVRNYGLTEDRVTRGLALQWSCPVLTLDGFEPRRMALVMPVRLCAEFGLMPLRVAGTGLLYLASSGHMDAGIALAVEQMSGLTVESGLLNESEMDAAQSRLNAVRAVPEQIRSAADADDLVQQMGKILEQRQPVASRLVRVHGYFWLRLWLEQGALSGTGRLPSGAEDMEDYLFTTGPIMAFA